MSIKHINVTLAEQTGVIQYCFKGIQMSSETARVVEVTNDQLTVERINDKQLFSFVRHKNKWLLKNNETSKSLLFGTQFVFC